MSGLLAQTAGWFFSSCAAATDIEQEYSKDNLVASTSEHRFAPEMHTWEKRLWRTIVAEKPLAGCRDALKGWFSRVAPRRNLTRSLPDALPRQWIRVAQTSLSGKQKGEAHRLSLPFRLDLR